MEGIIQLSMFYVKANFPMTYEGKVEWNRQRVYWRWHTLNDKKSLYLF